MNQRVLKFELSPQDVQIKKILNKEFLELDIHAISDIYPNRNKSAFTKDSLEKSKHTCYNKPILGAFNLITQDFDQHNGQMRYDKELDENYWDTTGRNDEKILGVIRESDDVDVVSEGDLNWLKITCVLWTYYSYKQVKRILKSATKKVSVEILVVKSHYDDDNIEIIDEFVLTGITILGDRISEGIPNAHLNVVELMRHKDFSQQMRNLSFALQKDGIDNNIKLEDFSNLYINTQEDKTMTYAEKLAFLTGKLSEVYPKRDGCCDEFYICDFSDDFVIIRDYRENKYFKINYEIITNEGVAEVTFDLEGRIEQVPSFKDFGREFVSIGEENKNIDELFDMYNTVVGELENTQNDFANFKAEQANKVFTVCIDGVEYDVKALEEKYNADLAEKQEQIDSNQLALNDMQAQYNAISEQFETLKAKVARDEADKLCGDGIALAESEEDLDDDDKKDICAKCTANKYTSLNEVEDDIARALYRKKKMHRSKNFKSAIYNNHNASTGSESIFDKL